MIANMVTGYVNLLAVEPPWFLLLAEVPGVTARHVTDLAGRADVAFRFPFSDVVTEILLNAGTYQPVGYARDGAQTVMTREAVVPRPGALTTQCAPDSHRCAS